jgi:nitrile hydratase accessory protein
MTPDLASIAGALPELPRDDEGPVFRAPWEAQAFAMAVSLHEQGVFTWKEWAATLAEVIKEVRTRGEADTGERYYEHWLTALERIAARKCLVTEEMLQQRRDAWDDAARHTPHGQPIKLPPRN